MIRETPLNNAPVSVENSTETDEGVVAHNIKMMEEDMMNLSNSESMGGNAGHIIIGGKEYPCIGLNGYADKQTGRIFAFSNGVSKNAGDIRFIFKQAINFEDMRKLAIAFADKTDGEFELAFSSLGKKRKVVNFGGASEFSERAKRNIKTAIATYNAKYWR